MLTAGTVSMINAGTITSVGTIPGIGVITTLTNGTINDGTVHLDGRPGRNILSYGTTFVGTASYGTLIGSAAVGVGTSIWVNDVSIVNSSGTVTALVGFGTALNGTSIIAKGLFSPNSGIEKSFQLPVNAGMTNQDLVCYISAAGTIDVNVSYFISV